MSDPVQGATRRTSLLETERVKRAYFAAMIDYYETREVAPTAGVVVVWPQVASENVLAEQVIEWVCRHCEVKLP